MEQSALLGRAVANVHLISDVFETRLSRQVLDMSYLLDDSIVAIEPYIDLESQRYLNKLRSKLKKALVSLPKSTGVYGICIGDVNPTNFHINGSKDITLSVLAQM